MRPEESAANQETASARDVQEAGAVSCQTNRSECESVATSRHYPHLNFPTVSASVRLQMRFLERGMARPKSAAPFPPPPVSAEWGRWKQGAWNARRGFRCKGEPLTRADRADILEFGIRNQRSLECRIPILEGAFIPRSAIRNPHFLVTFPSLPGLDG